VQAGVENGAMLTTYLFRYTSECTISWSNFQNFLLCLMRQGGIDPPNQNPEHGVVAQLVGITVDRSQVRFHKSQPRSPAGLQVLFRFSTLARTNS